VIRCSRSARRWHAGAHTAPSRPRVSGVLGRPRQSGGRTSRARVASAHCPQTTCACPQPSQRVCAPLNELSPRTASARDATLAVTSTAMGKEPDAEVADDEVSAAACALPRVSDGQAGCCWALARLSAKPELGGRARRSSRPAAFGTSPAATQPAGSARAQFSPPSRARISEGAATAFKRTRRASRAACWAAMPSTPQSQSGLHLATLSCHPASAAAAHWLCAARRLRMAVHPHECSSWQPHCPGQQAALACAERPQLHVHESPRALSLQPPTRWLFAGAHRRSLGPRSH